MSAARRRRKARRQAEFWAAGPTRTLTVTITADADQFRQAFGPFTVTDPDIARQIEETNRAARRLVDHHVDRVLAELDAAPVPTPFTRVDVGDPHPGANFPIHHTIGLPREDRP